MDEEGKVNFLELNRSIWGDEAPGWTYILPSGVREQVGIYLKDARIKGFETPGSFISTLFPLLFTIGGLILFVMLVWGSLEVFFAAGSAKLADSGKKRITSALIGFILLFSAFWIGQIISTIFGIDFGLSTS